MDTATPVVIEGRLGRKKKRGDQLVIAIREKATRSRPHQSDGDGDGNDEIELPSKYVSVSRRDGDGNNNPDLDFLCLEAVIRVECRPVACGAEGHEVLEAEDVRLVRCAPEPNAVVHVLGGVLTRRYSPSTLGPLVPDEDEARRVLSMLPGRRGRRAAVARIVRSLAGTDDAGAGDRTARRRPPHAKRADVEILRVTREEGLRGDGGWRWMEPKRDEAGPAEREGDVKCDGDDGGEASLDGHGDERCVLPLNLPGENSEREEYIRAKKLPQVRWMAGRVRRLPFRPRHIVDVGGGRGDLATGLALDFDECFVTVVDANLSSLRAGEEYASRMGCSDRMRFVHADMADFWREQHEEEDFGGGQLSPQPHWPPVDLVVALHACGDLSDLALAYAGGSSARAFVICPCCYTKRYIHSFDPSWRCRARDPNVLGRVAEVDERPDMSRCAMTAINSMRLCDMAAEGFDVNLEEYGLVNSRRNIVLVGVQQT